MNWREWVQDYLMFSRKERIGVLVIVLLILLIWIFPSITKSPKSKLTPADTGWITAAKLLRKQDKQTPESKTNDEISNEMDYDHSTNQQNYAGDLFYFDPNKVSRERWAKLGIREKTIDVIQKYLSKGGHFYKREDLKKIYGISPAQYSRLAPFIRIEESNGQDPPVNTNNEYKGETASTRSAKFSVVDINAADTSEFIALPGIGSKLASRIVNFRDRLGGFYSIDQVGETYGLVDSVFVKIKPLLRLENPSLKKIDINTCTKDDLKSHPYLRWSLATAIVEYRNQHGSFSSIEELKKITVITEDVFRKIEPYLTTSGGQ